MTILNEDMIFINGHPHLLSPLQIVLESSRLQLAEQAAEEGQPTPDLVVKSEALLRLYRNSQIGG